MRGCTVCRRDLPDGSDGYLCHRCEHHLRYVLRTLASTELPLLRLSLVPGASPSTGSRFGGRAHSPMPGDSRVLDLLGPGTPNLLPADPWGEQVGGVPLGPIITGWAQTIAAEHQAAFRRHGTTYLVPCTGPGVRGTTLDAWCHWLANYTPYAATRPWVREMHDELVDALERVRTITLTQPRTHQRLAPCPWCDAFAVTHTDGRWELDCQACGRTLDPAEYTAHASIVLSPLTRLTVRLAADITRRATPAPPHAPDERSPGATPQDGQRCA